jgi:hypothetical protein
MLPALMLVLTIPLQAVGALDPVGDSTYASTRVRTLVEQAAAAHARPPDTLASFTAHTETEIGLLLRGPDGKEVPTQMEQLAGRVVWRRDGSLAQTVTGYRARTLGVTLSALTYITAPWVVAPLYGDRVPLVLAEDSTRATSPTPDTSAAGERPPASAARKRRHAAKLLVHPFASDRERYYRFSGGDTVLVLDLPERRVPLVRVTVEPTHVPRDAFVFRGDIDLDAQRHQIVRMRGEFLARYSDPTLLTRLVDATLDAYYFVDLENAEWEGAVWLPYRQWIELEVKPGLSDERAIFRLVTHFSGTDVDPPLTALDSTAASGRPSRTLRVQPMDSLRGFDRWRRELGAATVEVNAGAFDDVAPDAFRPGGPPRLRLGGGGFSRVLRYDRVEGLFTGLGARLDLRDAAPGAYVDLHTGWAWAESTVRGGVEAGRRRGWWEAAVTARRELESTNDFPRSFGSRPSILGIFGTDDFDYVDRSSVEARLALVGPGGRVEVLGGVVRDRMPVEHVVDAPLGGTFRPLRPVDDGSYRHVLVRGVFGGTTGGEYLAPGLSGAASWELARGGLDWQRVEGFLRARSRRGRWTLAGEMYGGTVLGAPPPPQSLFELGSYAGRLPGFDYKAFTGDRAAVGALQAMFELPVLDGPVRVGPLFLPAVGPSPSLEIDGGWTGASAATAALLDRFGWTGTHGVRATIFLGIRVLGGALSVGAARPLGEAGRWRFALGVDPAG